MDQGAYKFYELEPYRKCLKDVDIVDCLATNIGEFKPDDERLLMDVTQRLTVSETLQCSNCKVSFKNLEEQRSHFKLDWHRYNLKQVISGQPSVTEDAFTNLADDVSSISGSESSSDESESENSSNQEVVATRHAQLLFKTRDDALVSVYRCLLQNKKENFSNKDLISSFNKLVFTDQQWMIIMLGGGHFAASVFRNNEPILHKTFHFYVVRAKQGGSQSAQDKKGSFAKSAGASIRRHNEQSLVQHIQDLFISWSTEVAKCNLILYRAAGPQNRSVLFSGKNPPLDKNDLRLRCIPFPTRRATFNEVKRVFDILSTIKVHGSVEQFQKVSVKKSPSHENKNESIKARKTSPSKIDRAKERKSPIREIPGEDIKSVDSMSGSSDIDFQQHIEEFSTQGLKEFEDSVPQWVKDAKKQNRKRKKKMTKNKIKMEKDKLVEELQDFHKKIVSACRLKDRMLLLETLKIIDTLKTRSETADDSCDHVTESSNSSSTRSLLTKEDVIECLNNPVNKDTNDTVLHLSASLCLPEFVTVLLESGADPTIKNGKHLPPYSVSGDKETKNSFKEYLVKFPDKYDYKKAQIPEPLTDEQIKELEERKKDKKKAKREKEKIKKKIAHENKTENEEKARFLQLSDREKRALAAEKRIVQSTTSNVHSKAPVLSRCFECGIDITGKVPFEYDIHRFCSVVCLKAHRVKTNSFGKEI